MRAPAWFGGNEGDHLHSEQGGPEGAIVLLSMTAVDGVIWEVFDEADNQIDTATIEDFSRVLARQRAAKVPA